MTISTTSTTEGAARKAMGKTQTLSEDASNIDFSFLAQRHESTINSVYNRYKRRKYKEVINPLNNPKLVKEFGRALYVNRYSKVFGQGKPLLGKTLMFAGVGFMLGALVSPFFLRLELPLLFIAAFVSMRIAASRKNVASNNVYEDIETVLVERGKLKAQTPLTERDKKIDAFVKNDGNKAWLNAKQEFYELQSPNIGVPTIINSALIGLALTTMSPLPVLDAALGGVTFLIGLYANYHNERNAVSKSYKQLIDSGLLVSKNNLG